ncbi:hypothetical protein BELL_0625g00020 [Botrytis elliptica]|uniref:Uncharacterized protein n=1 Tax=Botrytis elliptica TaxID=278938 RepID=A0A4Z1JQ86_9HELO|nr:hypothetical protein BELL_0625g00020 [Botrytis elliptica]
MLFCDLEAPALKFHHAMDTTMGWEEMRLGSRSNVGGKKSQTNDVQMSDFSCIRDQQSVILIIGILPSADSLNATLKAIYFITTNKGILTSDAILAHDVYKKSDKQHDHNLTDE